MLVHIEIAAGVHVEIKRAVTCNQFKHVIEEADSRRDARRSTPIEIQLQADVRLVGLAMNFSCAWHDQFSLRPVFRPESSILFELPSAVAAFRMAFRW